MSFLINPYIYASGPSCTGDRVNLFNYAYWPLDGNSNGTPVNGTDTSVTYGSSFVGTGFDQAATFNGTSSYIDFGHNTIFEGTGGTISAFAWVKFTDFASDGNQHIFSKRNATTAGWRFMIQWSAPNIILSVGLQNTNNTYSTTGGFAVTTGQTAHIGFTYDANTVVYYVNGASASTTVVGSKNIAPGASYSLNVGKRNAASDGYVKGSLDDTAIFQRVLTGAEVSAIYDAGPPNNCPLSA